MAAGSGSRDLSSLFGPRSVAVVGASSESHKWGGDIAARLVATEGPRRVYLVNRRGGEICGRTAFPSLSDLPEVPDLAVLAIPEHAFEATLDEGLALGVRAFLAVFAGVGETGAEGRERERAAAERVRAAGSLLLGPNCIGLADAATGFSAVVFLDVPFGEIGLVSQSGVLAEDLVMRAQARGLGFSRYVTLGNQADVSVNEVLADFATHEPTRVVVLYVEDVLDGRGFLEAAQAVIASGRPVVLLSPGRSEASRRAARSHTGSLAADDAVMEAACKAAGIVRVSTPRELIDAASALLSPFRIRGRRVAVLAQGGGLGAVAADVVAASGCTVPAFSADLNGRLRRALPASAGSNPLDFALESADPTAFSRSVGALAGSHEIDALLVVGLLGLRSERMSHETSVVEGEVKAAREMAEVSLKTGMPLVVNTTYADSAPADELRSANIPVFREIDAAVAALVALREAGETPLLSLPALPERAEAIGRQPDYDEARTLLEAAGLPMVPGRRVSGRKDALAAGEDIGYPVVLKALGLLHKSDEGGVALGLADAARLAAAVDDMTRRLAPSGFVVERMVSSEGCVEAIVGCRRDPRFGPVALVGIGGVFTEVLRDAAVALAPVDEATAAALLERLRGSALFGAVRGRPALDVASAATALAALSRFAAVHPEVTEVEVNPLLVRSRGAVALDARVLIDQGEESG